MKIAMCFYGVHPDETNKKSNVTKNLVPYYLKKNIFDANSTIDCFVHSWSENRKEQILKEYNPTDCIIEKQKKFDIPTGFKNKGDNDGENVKNKKVYKLTTFEVYYSMTYSIKKVVSLMNKYENKNELEYDIVILSMMDCIWLVPLKLDNIDRTAIYNPIWGKSNEHSIKDNYKSVHGMWVISGSNYIRRFSALYDNLSRFLRKYGEKSSMHTIFKDQQDLITNNIKYMYNDIDNTPIESDRNRYLAKYYTF